MSQNELIDPLIPSPVLSAIKDEADYEEEIAQLHSYIDMLKSTIESVKEAIKEKATYLSPEEQERFSIEQDRIKQETEAKIQKEEDKRLAKEKKRLAADQLRKEKAEKQTKKHEKERLDSIAAHEKEYQRGLDELIKTQKELAKNLPERRREFFEKIIIQKHIDMANESYEKKRRI